MTIEAEFAVEREEASQAALVAHEALAGPYRPRLFAFIGMSLGLLVAPSIAAAAAFVVSLLGPHSATLKAWLAPALLIGFAVLGWQIGTDVALRRHRRRFRLALADRDVPGSILTSYSLEPGGLRISSERVTHLVPWPALIQVIASPTHWLLQADNLTFVLPRRAFQARDSERAFVRDLLERMDPAASARSTGASQFVGKAE